MKKNLLLILFFIIAFTEIKAADWFPIGSKWTWDYNLCCPPERFTDKWEAIKDTVIGADTFKIMNQLNTRWDANNRIIVKEQNQKAYRWLNNDLLPICDFTKSEHDTVLYIAPRFGELDSFLYVIDSIRTLPQNLSLRIQYIRLIKVNSITNPNGYFPSEIIEKTLFYGFQSADQFFIIDGAYDMALRCYRDNILNFNLTSIDCDSVLLSAKEKLSTNLNIKIYPNPAKNNIQIEFKNKRYKDATITILDMRGKILKIANIENDLQNQTIEVSTIANGIYFLKLTLDNEFIIKQLIIQR